MKTWIKYTNRIPVKDKKLIKFFDLLEYSMYEDEIPKRPEKVKENITVFIVDDDPIHLMALERYLITELPHLNIKLFKTGEESLEKLNESPDIIVLDYFLNSEDNLAKNGIHILKKIKKRRPDTKVIMLTCNEHVKAERKCIKHGALEYIYKSEAAFVMIKYLIKNLTGDDVFWID